MTVTCFLCGLVQPVDQTRTAVYGKRVCVEAGDCVARVRAATRSQPPEPPRLAGHPIYSCPDHDTDLADEGFTYWCPFGAGHAVSVETVRLMNGDDDE